MIPLPVIVHRILRENFQNFIRTVTVVMIQIEIGTIKCVIKESSFNRPALLLMSV